jgi:hypothetical protein
MLYINIYIYLVPDAKRKSVATQSCPDTITYKSNKILAFHEIYGLNIAYSAPKSGEHWWIFIVFVKFVIQAIHV